MCALVVEREAGAKSCSKAFIHQIDATTTCFMDRVAHRTLLNRGSRSGNADDEMPAPEPVGHVTDERAQHLLGHFVIEDRAGANRSMDLDAARLAPKKPQCLMSD